MIISRAEKLIYYQQFIYMYIIYIILNFPLPNVYSIILRVDPHPNAVQKKKNYKWTDEF